MAIDPQRAVLQQHPARCRGGSVEQQAVRLHGEVVAAADVAGRRQLLRMDTGRGGEQSEQNEGQMTHDGFPADSSAQRYPGASEPALNPGRPRRWIQRVSESLRPRNCAFTDGWPNRHASHISTGTETTLSARPMW